MTAKYNIDYPLTPSTIIQLLHALFYQEFTSCSCIVSIGELLNIHLFLVCHLHQGYQWLLLHPVVQDFLMGLEVLSVQDLPVIGWWEGEGGGKRERERER